VGTGARRELEKITGGKVYMNLWVKVKKDWREDDAVLRELGYTKKSL
jgi:GTP-binding protein Era